MTQTCGAIFDKNGEIRFIDTSTSEADCWRIHLGWPDKEEIEDAKKRGRRFARVEVREVREPTLAEQAASLEKELAREPTIAELRAEIARLQEELSRRILGDPREGVTALDESAKDWEQYP